MNEARLPPDSPLEWLQRARSNLIQARYPGFAEPVTEEEYNQAVKLAIGVINWVSGLLNC